MEQKESIEYLRVMLLLIFVTHSVADDDAAAMNELAAVLPPAPPKWTPNLSSHYCTWGKGIICDDSKKVTDISLFSLSLAGSLPSPFPCLPKLQVLELSNNSFSGSVPSFTNLTSLRSLSLGQNKFTSITSELLSGISSSLEYFSISDNPLLNSWKIPTELARFTNIWAFYARNASVVGHIPDVFSSCSVVRLSLSYNNLSGSLPTSFGRSRVKEQA